MNVDLESTHREDRATTILKGCFALSAATIGAAAVIIAALISTGGIQLTASRAPTLPVAVLASTSTPQPTYTPYPTFTQPPTIVTLPTQPMVPTATSIPPTVTPIPPTVRPPTSQPLQQCTIILYENDNKQIGWNLKVTGDAYNYRVGLPQSYWGVSLVEVPSGCSAIVGDEIGGGGHSMTLGVGTHNLMKMTRERLSYDSGGYCQDGLAYCWNDHVVWAISVAANK